jgi:SET domain
MIRGANNGRRRGVGIFATEDLVSGAILTHEQMVTARVGFDHSCDPNVGPVEKDADVKPFRRVLRGVKAGEELTVDYGVHNAKPNPCDCLRCKP